MIVVESGAAADQGQPQEEEAGYLQKKKMADVGQAAGRALSCGDSRAHNAVSSRHSPGNPARGLGRRGFHVLILPENHALLRNHENLPQRHRDTEDEGNVSVFFSVPLCLCGRF